MHRGVVALLPLLLVPSFLASAEPAAPSTRSGGKSVCVLSAIGDKFSVQKIGITIFGNELNEIAIGSWGIDDLVVRKIGAILSKRYAVRRIGFPNGAIAAIEQPGGSLFRNRDDELREAVRAAAAASAKCDLYVAVNKSRSGYANTNQTLAGLGILDTSILLIDKFNVFVSTTIKVYDGQTFAVLQGKFATTEPTTLQTILLGSTIPGPHREVDKSWWPATPQAAAQDARMRDAIRALVEQSLAVTVPEML
jgi:hypothetical protein